MNISLASSSTPKAQAPATEVLDALGRRIIAATQAGLPVSKRPYEAVAKQLGISPELLMQRLRKMQACGLIRRIGAVPNHYRLGYRANAMTVWDVPDEAVARLGPAVGALDFVSHCYRRPRHLPAWPYNLYAMVHARQRSDAEIRIATIAELLGRHCRSHDVLYSTRILKKTGFRLPDTERSVCSG